MSWENEQAVCQQMANHGLLIDGLEVGTIKPVRCKIDSGKGTKGWYWLSEYLLDDGAIILNGSFGIWHGLDNGHTNIMMPERICKQCGASMPRTKKICPYCKSKDLRVHEVSKTDRAAMRKKQMDNKRKMKDAIQQEHDCAAMEAAKIWRGLNDSGTSNYLERKHIKPFGIRFTADGELVVPILDTDGRIHGLQYILDKSNEAHKSRIKKMETDKIFSPKGLGVSGHFCVIGESNPNSIMLVAEGYATGASLHMATKLPVFVTFNANNILPVLQVLERYYPHAHFLICADDDYLCRCSNCNKQTPVSDHSDKHPRDRELISCVHCGMPHGKINTGVTVAMKASMSVDCAEWTIPQFIDRTDLKTNKPIKLTDFNDLHVTEVLQAVKSQITAAITDKFPTDGSFSSASLVRDAHSGGAGKTALHLLTVDEAVCRYAYIYGVKDTMFDRALCKLVPKTCVLDITRGRAWDDIKSHPDFKIIDIDTVGFDASESDPSVLMNMYSGMENIPCDIESCDAIKDLVDYLVSAETKPREVRHQLLCWLAYPLQNPGSKIDWSVVMHGDQGAGKSILFEKIMMPIYGKYATLIGQEALDDKFNEWASKKLFIVADEVVARQELYHTKNVLKKYITGKYIPINPKNVAKYTEKNQMNFVFLSNEDKPVVLENGDRRYLVIRTPEFPPTEGIFNLVGDEINHGGIASFHAFLMNYDCKDFDPHAKPMMTTSKEELLDLCKEPPICFADAWLAGDLDVPPMCCLLEDLYKYFRRWSDRSGERFIATLRAFSSQLQRHPSIQTGRAHRKTVMQSNGKAKPMNVVLIDDDPKPDGQAMMTWLAQRIATFHSAMDEF